MNHRPAPESRPQPTDEQLLAFEADHTPGKHTSAKEIAIRDELGIHPARYYLLLGRLIWLEDALRIDPALTNRLRRLSRERQLEQRRRHHT
ncbi:DUF3263 domain-containing protein [Microbacterium enclense]|uniref:DUF3263 domain-containing protein n=1 Tax=Microbacterium enclense TaxID=993073 RepID=UPI0021A50E32|nr:DUF3263 domain-containing protein [Microbacterium enclense]MCT2085067.1 DUF3263 domain-containing protein [Microbacterium enclense]